ncbi:MAG: hypothetical protein ACJATI_000259 [Halioglobus sp.]|jgi:hypothetical protein
MKYPLLLIFVFAQSSSLFSGDYPCGATLADLQSSYINYDVSGSSYSGFASAFCIDASSLDYWFQVSVVSNAPLFLIMIASTEQANIALYKGDGSNPVQVLCYVVDSCINGLPQL